MAAAWNEPSLPPQLLAPGNTDCQAPVTAQSSLRRAAATVQIQSGECLRSSSGEGGGGGEGVNSKMLCIDDLLDATRSSL